MIRAAPEQPTLVRTSSIACPPVGASDQISRRGWLLFGVMGAIWGVPYLLIKVAVEHVEPPVVVFGRTALPAVALTVLAARSGVLAPALARWPYVVAFALIEMAGPWFLLSNAERHVPSGVAGLLVSCVPIVGALVSALLGDRSAVRAGPLLGIAIGMAGVALIVSHDLGAGGSTPWWSVIQILLVCVGYAIAPFIADRHLSDVPPLGTIAASLMLVAVIYAPLAWITRPDENPPAKVWLALLGLGVLCTAIAFTVFFRLIAEVGPARSTLITFINPAVAVVLGALILDEQITGATVAGFVLVVGGCWLATRRARTTKRRIPARVGA